MELQPDAPPAPVPSERDWSELPLDVLTSVFAGLGAVDVLMGAGFVCHSWLEAAKAPGLWRKVDMGHGPRDKEMMEKRGIDLDDPNQVMCAMAKVAVDRSDGKLEVFVGEKFVTDETLNYIGASLARSEITNEELMAVVDACPCLRYLSVVDCYNIVADGALRAKCATVKMLELPTSVWMSSMEVRPSGMSDDYYDSDQDDDTAFYPSWISDDDDGRCHNYGLDDDLDPDYDLYPYYDYDR